MCQAVATNEMKAQAEEKKALRSNFDDQNGLSSHVLPQKEQQVNCQQTCSALR